MSIGQIGDHLLTKRMRVVAPDDFSIPVYSAYEFAKQMDMEFMKIEVNDRDYRAKDCVMPRTYRTMVRSVDEFGKFKRLNMELEELA
jgi:hypothetical protein